MGDDERLPPSLSALRGRVAEAIRAATLTILDVSSQIKLLKETRLRKSKPFSEDKANERVDEITNLITQVSAVTGVTFTSSTSLLISGRRQFTLAGRANDLKFQIRFYVNAEAGGNSAKSAIENLEIRHPPGVSHSELAALVSRHTNHPNGVSLFLRGAGLLGSVRRKRRSVFSNLQKDFPGRIHLPHGASSGTAILECKTLKVAITWGVNISDEGSVFENVSWTPHLHARVVESVSGALSPKSMAECYESIAAVMGISSAVSIMARTLLE